MGKRTRTIRQKRLNDVSLQQKRFLYTLRDHPRTLHQLVEQLNVKPWQMHKWLRTPLFRQTLADTLREARRYAKLELDLAARHAIHVLSGMVSGRPGTHLMRQACFDVLDAYHTHVRTRRRRIKSAPLQHDEQPQLNQNLVHPDNTEEETLRLLDILEGKQSSD